MSICNCAYAPPEDRPCLHCRRRVLAILPRGVTNPTINLSNEHDGKPSHLAEYIVDWLKVRNRGELAEAFDNMRVGDLRLLLDELTLILICGGRPPNWVS